MQDNNSYLYHHGVKGQSWGKKNGPPYPLDDSISTGKSLRKKKKGGVISKLKKMAADRRKRAKETTRTNKKYKTMTDEELQKAVRRLNLEKQYKDLKRQDVSRGRQMIVKALEDAGQKVISQIAQDTIGSIYKASKG